MTKYIARVTHAEKGTYYRMKSFGLPIWAEDVRKAFRFDTEEDARKSLETGAVRAAGYDKEVLVAPEDRIYAAARSRRTGTLRYRTNDSGKWYLSPDPKLAHAFSARSRASQSFNGLNNQVYNFKVGTMDEIQKWYDQFGKSEPVIIDDIGDQVEGFKPSTMFIDESHWLRDPPTNHDFKPIGFVLHHTAEPANQPEIVKIRRSVESAVSSELSWDTEKMGVIVDFLGSDFLEEGMTVDKLYSVLYDLHEEMTEDDES